MPPDRSPDGIGRKLRDARERRGISLRQVSTATKISIAALEAIEQDDPGRLPGGIFSRAFVRSYAAEVGLNPDQAVQDFLAQFPQEPPPGVPPSPIGDGRDPSVDRQRTRPSAQVEDGEALESERQMASTFLRLIFFSIPIAIIVVYLGTRPPREPVDPPAAEIPAAAAPERAVPAPATQPAALDTTPPANLTATPDTGDAFTVALSASGPCWVAAAVDGKRVVERLMQAGEQQTLAVHGELVLTAGDPSALTVRINGAATRPLGRAGQVVTTRMNASNFQSFLPRP